MKLLLIHSDYLEYEPKEKAIQNAEEVEKEKKRVEECLVVFAAVEKSDEKNPKICVSKTVNNIIDVAKQLNIQKIVVYPWVHLTNEPALSSTALNVLKEIEEALRTEYDVHRAPFGWYKKFNISCKGHPLSELSREISVERDEVSDALKKEEALESEWFVVEPGGTMHKIEIKNGKIHGFDFSKHKNFEKMVKYEMAKNRLVDKEPAHIKLMKKLELVNYEPASDPGHFTYLPKGKLIKSLIEEWVTQKTVEYGAIEVETPIMYDYEHPALKNYLHRFPARQYTIQTPNKRVFLRFSACFGQFLLANRVSISYKDLPMRLYELTRYSFRVEQRGELAGLRRLRAFTMPDCHAFCKDIEQAKEEILRRFELAMEIQYGLGFENEDFEYAIRVVKDFFEEHKEFVLELIRKMNKPVLMEMWEKRFFYFILKHEWNFVDALNKAACLTTDQIDVENAKRYEIKFTDSDNKKKYPIVLHLSPSGSVERVMYALLEKAYLESKQGKNPVFPLWLSPTQVRLCPVNDTFIEYAKKISNEMEKHKIRVDIDDRAESISKKIRDAEIEWVPLIVVIGEKEKEKGMLAVRFRENGKIKEMRKKDLINYIMEKTKEKPFRPLPSPKLLSKRPVFIG